MDWPRRVIEEGEGGQRRVRCDQAPEWWQRLEIIQEAGGDALRFIAATDRARAEVTLAAGQLRLADGFIEQASRSAATNTEAAKTLFEMLLPNRLRELAPQQRNLVVLVDEVSARFPWELLEDRWSHTGRPPAVTGGMVRQLKTPTYRAHPAHAQEAKAYVVGNPDLDGWNTFPDLPGARDEANRVAQLLRDHGFQVQDRIDEKADAIMNGLHKDAWRILHLAGHGEHEFAVSGRPADGCPTCGQVPPPVAERISGMVIGKETFLTPGDVEQMRWVPELVFINCCHLGKTQRDHTGPLQRPGGQPGGAVHPHGGQGRDRGRLGGGRPGRAGLRRAFLYRRCSPANRSGRRSAPPASRSGSASPTSTPGAPTSATVTRPMPCASRRRPPRDQARRPYHAPCELVADLTNLREQIRMQVRERGEDPQTLTDLRTRIEDLITAIPEAERTDWLARADLAAAIGLTWGETRAWKEAVTWLDQALAAEIGDCPVRVVEQGNEFRVRVIGEEWQTLRAEPEGYQKEDRRQTLVERVEQSIAELVTVCQRAPTAPRLYLIGQACRQLAWLQTEPRGRLEALVNMANFLERALAKTEHADARYFPLWAAAKLLALGLDAERGGDWQARLPDDLRRMSAAASQLNDQEPSFRNGVAVAYNETALLLTQVAPAAGDVAAVIDRYQEVFRRGASPREVASVYESLDFLIDLGECLPAPAVRALNEIRAAL